MEKCGFIPTGETCVDDETLAGSNRPMRVLRLEIKRLIAFCGFDCGKCDAYIATKRNEQALREKTAKLWAELNQAPILPEDINCEGCKTSGVKIVFCSSMCEIRKCAMAKGIDTQLLLQMLDLLRQKGYRQVSLSVQKANYALRMYRKAGFEVIADREEEVLMACRIGNEQINRKRML